MKRVRRADVEIGTHVTVREAVTAYHGDDATLEPGHVGIVGAVRVPYVRHREGNSTEFVCVDFWVEGHEEWEGNHWSKRAGVDYRNLVLVGDETPITALPEGGRLKYFCGAWLHRRD